QAEAVGDDPRSVAGGDGGSVRGGGERGVWCFRVPRQHARMGDDAGRGRTRRQRGRGGGCLGDAGADRGSPPAAGGGGQVTTRRRRRWRSEQKRSGRNGSPA